MSALRVYVAGSSQDVDTIRALMGELRALGIVVTHDWTISVLEAKRRGMSFGDIDPDVHYVHAFADLRGVLDADIVWIVVGSPSLGAWTELGAALGQGTIVIVSGAWEAVPNIFLSMCRCGFDMHSDAIDHLAEMHRVCSGGAL